MQFLLRSAVTFSLYGLIAGRLLLREKSQALTNTSIHLDGTCLSLKGHSGGSYYTTTVKFGESKKSASLVVDTGSPYLVVAEGHVTDSTKLSSTIKSITYGSGTLVCEKGTDVVSFGTSSNRQTVYYCEAATYGFPSIEGILPLGNGCSSVIHATSFSICFSGAGGGSLSLGASGASISTNGQWEGKIKSVTVGGDTTNINSKFIPDSGTSDILIPLKDADKFFAVACSSWSKCNQSSALAFFTTLKAHTDAPSLELDLGGTTISVPSSDVYTTSGSTWILGAPVFRKYKVIYDVNSKKIGFKSGCGCGGSLKEDAAPLQDVQVKRKGPPRVSTVAREKIGKMTEEEASSPLGKLTGIDPYLS